MYKKKIAAVLFLVVFVLGALTETPMVVSAASKKTVQKVEIKKPASEVLVLKKGKTYKLKTAVYPENVKTNLTYKSSKRSIATVDKSGKITAKKNGKTQIVVTAKQKKTKKDKITVIVGTPVKSVKMNQTSAAVKAGESVQLKVSVSPKKSSYKKVKWESSDAAVASVSSNGTVKANAAGKASITVKTTDGTNKKAVCKIIVEAANPAPDPSDQQPTPKPDDQQPTPKPDDQQPTPKPDDQQPTPKPDDQQNPGTEQNPQPEPGTPEAPVMTPIEEILENENLDTPYGYTLKQKDVDYGEIVDITYESQATNSTRKAKVLLPAGYTEDKKYPVLYMMHGIGGTEKSLLEIDHIEYVIGNAIHAKDAEEMIVVFPNGCANETGLPPANADFYSLVHYQAYDNFVNDLELSLMPYMEDNFSIAVGRENTAIAGFSMGGRVALHVGFTLQDSFRYIGALCPAFGILEYTNNGVHENGLFTKDTFTLSDQYMKDTLVLIAAGKNDGIVRDEPKKYHEALEQNEVPHIFYETLGGENYTGDGGHSGDVYKHGLYNLMRRMFQKSSN